MRALPIVLLIMAACTPGRSPQKPELPRRVVVFRADGFPTIDAPAIDDALLDRALEGLPASRSSDLASLGRHDLLVLPYGSAFPVDHWARIRAFLKDGGSLVVLGGAPFHEPVALARGQWARGPRQPAFAHDLAIGPAEPIAIPPSYRSVDVPGFAFGPSTPRTTWALTLRLSDTKTFPDEHGSEGPRTGVAHPLAHVVDERGIPRGCPLLEIERPTSRWLFATSDAALDARVVRAIVERAMSPPRPKKIVIDRVTVDPGADVTIHTEGAFQVLDESGKEIARGTGARFKAPRTAGLYTVVSGGARNAFWVRDDRLRRGPALSVSRDFLRKDGRPFPIVGTTYMASDAHRQFLFEPNPDTWDRDFAEMKRSGVGFVRTGLWTAWSRAAKDGVVRPEVLDALEAFVLTAQRHDIVVCFNFFAFLPPWGFDHPYLDPRALAAQKKFVTAFAARFANSPWIHWDLINEPSYAPRSKLWQTRAIGGTLEREAFARWAKKRHGDTDLRSLWHDPGDVLAPPDDFEQTAVMVHKRPRKTRDFRELVEEIVAQWAAELRRAIHDAGGGLVTLGQDEGGLYERPTQAFLASSLDYTAVHTWWKNDDLLWDGVLTKTTARPNLHQETGLMRLEDLDGRPWRSPEDAASLLERKIGYAFAARGAGVVEWVWNVNPYMPLDEEATIGLIRPDGTVKPERDVLERFARFFAAHGAALDDFDPDSVLLVIPHARAFLGRTGALDATKEAVRVLAEHFGVVPTAISDLLLDVGAHVKLVIVPAPEVLDERAAHALLEASRRGTKILVTGAIEGDSYGRPTPSLQALGLLGPSRRVAMREASPWSERGIVFEGLAQESVRRAESRQAVSFDGGNVWHEPLPLERSRDREPLVKLYGTALARAGVPVSRDDGGVVGRVLTTATHALLVCVNERPTKAKRKLLVDGRTIELDVRPEGVRMAIVDRKTGAIEASFD
jgi:hypothetical protein